MFSFLLSIGYTCTSVLRLPVGPDYHSAKIVLILTMENEKKYR
jgi:hypothetical protein